MRWLSAFSKPPTMTYLVHGESEGLEALRDRVEGERQWRVHVAAHEERVQI